VVVLYIHGTAMPVRYVIKLIRVHSFIQCLSVTDFRIWKGKWCGKRGIQSVGSHGAIS